MARYLVTGAAGFIGSRVSALLLDMGAEVTGIDNLNDAYDTRLKDWRLERMLSREGFDFFETDISDPAQLGEAWGDAEFEAVFNLAARAGVRASLAQPWLYFETNVRGLLNLLELGRQRGVGKFIQASTSSLYGNHNPVPFEESADTSRPLSPYSASKGAAEMMCYSYHHLYDIDIAVLRYFTVYGPAGRPDMSIFRFIQWIAEGRPVTIFGDGEQTRDFTFVDDIARGTVSALDVSGFEIINLGGDKPASLNDVIRRIESLLGKPAQVEHHAAAPADVRTTWARIDRAGSLLGWEPATDLEQGLEACVAWYLAEREWARHVVTTD